MSFILDALRKADLQRQRGAAPTLLAVQEPAVARKRPAILIYGVLAVLLVGAGIGIGWLRPWQPEPEASVVTKSVESRSSESRSIDSNSMDAMPPGSGSMQAESTPLETAPPETVPLQPAPLQPAPVPPTPVPPTPAPSAMAPQPKLESKPEPKSQSVARPAQPAPATSDIASLPKPEPSARAKPETAPPRAADAAAPEGTPALPVDTATAVATDAPAVIPMADLPLSVRQELPAMTISVHAYSDNPASRLVGIDSRILREGDDIVAGLKLEQITPDGMILGFKGYRFSRGVR